MSHDNRKQREKYPGTGNHKGHDAEVEHGKVPAHARKPLPEPVPVTAGSAKTSCHRWEH